MGGGVDAGGEWAIGFKQDQCFRCFGLVSGECWLSIDGVANPTRLATGDFVVLPHGRPFCLRSDLELAPVDIGSVVMAPLNGRIFSYQGGGACLALSALFTFAGDHASLLLGVLPPIVHIRNDSDRAAMHWYLERMMAMLRNPQPGSVLLGEHLAQMMLIEVLRLHVAGSAASGVGWLFALRDKQVNIAITAMHKKPGHHWTLQELGEHAGMSRSAFAVRFKEKVGTGAMQYLTGWRMLLATDRLTNPLESVSEIALSLGYESESAFCFAFKREMGCSPRRYCRPRSSASTSPVSSQDLRENSLQNSATGTLLRLTEHTTLAQNHAH